ncbi:MAG: type II secretion system protein [Bacilli bacterium]|nr:type II secretion system protein [Bacilli bacterium]
MKHIHPNRKGFTMVELLAVIVIVGALSVMGIVGVSRYIQSSKTEKENQEKKNIAMAAKMYMQANRELLPRTIGDSAVVQVSELRRTNYLKTDVTDKSGNSCMEKSFVRVYKLDEQEYSYNTYLYCGDVEVPEEVEVPQPEIINFKFNGYSEGSDFSNVKTANFSFKINGNHEDTTIGIYSYSYTIYAKSGEDASGGFAEVYYSGDIKAGYEPTIDVVSKPISQYFDATGYNAIRIRISAVNEQGGKVEFSSNTGGFKDTDNPLCGLVSGQALNDEDWVNKTTFNSGTYKNNYRRITVACSDEFGSGCKRDSFTVSWPTDSQASESGINYAYGTRWSYITLSDNAQDTNSTRCYVRANVDVKAPEVRVNVYKAKADGTKDGKIAEIVVRDDGKKTSVLPSGTLQHNAYVGVTGTGEEKWLNKENFPYGIIIDADFEDNIWLYNYEWAVNNPYVAGGSSDATISSTASVANARTEGTTTTSYIFPNPNMTDNPTNDTQLATAEHGVQTGNARGFVIKREGKRYGRLTVCDKAKNCTTVHIYVNIDRTPPLVPDPSYEKITSHTAYTPANASDYTAHTKWSNEYLRPYISGQREDRQTENASVQVQLSGWDHFNYSYKKQTGKNSSGLTWADPVTRDVYNPFGGTTQYGFEIRDQGTHKVAFKSCDRAGNCSQYGTENYPKVDTIKPTCGITTTYSGTTGPNSAGWLKNGQSVVLGHTCADEDTKFSSGCNPDDFHNKQTYNFNSDINTSKAGANGYNTTYGANDNTVGGHVVDYAGNMSQECPKMTVKIDYVAPSCSTVISHPQGAPLNPTDATKPETGWLGLLNGVGPTKKTAVVSLRCTDVDSPATSLMSGVKSNCDSNNASNKQSHTYNTEMNITNAGAGGAGVGGSVYDIAGNVTNCPADRTVKIDYTVPVCTTSISYGTGMGVTHSNEEFYPATGLLSSWGWLGVTNDGSPVKEMAKVTQVCTDPNGSQRSGCNGVIRHKIYDYEINTSNAGAVGVGDNGTVADKAGNKASCTGFHTVKIDYTAPVCVVTGTSSGSGNGYNWTNNNYTGGWVGRGATVTLKSTCTSAESGQGTSSGCATNNSKEYKSEISTTEALASNNVGACNVYDKADNKSVQSCETKTVRIDLSSPTCTVEARYGTSVSNTSPIYDGSWKRGTNKVRVISQCTADNLGNGETGSGCADSNKHYHDFSVSSGNILNTSGGSADNGGAYVIKDKVGNSRTCGKHAVKLDYQPPTCTLTAVKDTGGASGTYRGEWTNADSVSVLRNCRDGSGSGCNTSANEIPIASYMVPKGSYWETSSAGAIEDGNSGSIVDNVGNSTVCPANVTIRLDQTDPTCTIEKTNYSTSWTNKKITLQGKCSDTGSGCKTTNKELKEVFSTDTENRNYTYDHMIYDKAGNSAHCTESGLTILTWKTLPRCWTEKIENTLNKTTGVDAHLFCKNASGQANTGPNLSTCDDHDSGHSYYTVLGNHIRGATSTKTYRVTDEAGNSNTCKLTITAQNQYRYKTCSACKSCEGAGCKKYKKCRDKDCGTESYEYNSTCTGTAQADGYKFKGKCDSGGECKPKSYCTELSGTSRTSCKYSYSYTYSCKKTGTRNKECRAAGCGCEEYNTSCETCGCESGKLSDYSDWTNGTKTDGWSGDKFYDTQTIYY